MSLVLLVFHIRLCSRVINSKPDVSNETRKRVEAVIQELGYKPSVIARSLIQQRSYTIGVVTAGLKYIGPSRTLNGITQQAEEKGYTLLLKELPSFDTNNVQYLVDSLLSRHVDGIIWAAPEIGENRKWIEENSIDLSIPIIFLSMHPIEGISIIDVDNYLGGQIAAQHLIDYGYKNIGLISGPSGLVGSKAEKIGLGECPIKKSKRDNSQNMGRRKLVFFKRGKCIPAIIGSISGNRCGIFCK